MDCQEAQSNILNFINHKMGQDETLSFIEHIRECSDCWEELEIYYVILVGLRQLDGREEIIADFRERLKKEIDCQYEMIEREERKQHIIKTCFSLAAFLAGMWLLIYLILLLF